MYYSYCYHISCKYCIPVALNSLQGRSKQAFQDIQQAYEQLLEHYGYGESIVPEFENPRPAKMPRRRAPDGTLCTRCSSPPQASRSNSAAQPVVRWEVQYCVKARKRWWPLDENSMYEIEHAFQMGEAGYVYTWSPWSKQYLLNFGSMTQVNAAGGEPREMRRVSIDTA